MSDDLEIFELTSGERNSAMWLRIKAWLDKRLHDLQCRNENANLSADQTAALRGQIAEIRVFIRLGEEPPFDGTTNAQR